MENKLCQSCLKYKGTKNLRGYNLCENCYSLWEEKTIANKTNGSDYIYCQPNYADPSSYYPGLTKREYIASQQMAAFIMNGEYLSAQCAKNAVIATDLLIEELNK